MSTVIGTPLSGDFNHQLYEFLKTPGIEGFVDHVYTDTKGIPTVGVGYALIVGSPGHYSLKSTYQSDLSGILSQSQISTLGKYLNQALIALNSGSGTTTNNPFINSKSNFLGWTLSDVVAPGDTKSQAEQFFDKTVNRYTPSVQKWLGSSPAAVKAFNALVGTREMLVLTSQAYNGLINVGHSPGLRAAILDGNRAEAWFQIRYSDPVPHGRRYAEAAAFGLYNDPGNVTEEDALQVFRICSKYTINKLLSYDSQHVRGFNLSQNITYPSGTSFPKPEDLLTSLTPAAQELTSLYGVWQQPGL